jgi:hypothetical protein
MQGGAVRSVLDAACEVFWMQCALRSALFWWR